jgi:DNA-binding response OmpR family regulator
MAEILLVEDNANLSDVIVRELSAQEFQVTPALDGNTALQQLTSHSFDAIILDWMLPDIDGLEIMRRMQVLGINTPVLMLTARSEEVDRIVGLEVGADDYLTKPFSMHELVASLHALLRRVEKARQLISPPAVDTKQVFSCGALRIDLIQHRVISPEQEYDLTPLEFELLALLAGNPGRVFNRSYLMETVWQDSFIPGDRSVDNAILRLRKKLYPYGDSIESVWGVGYRLNAEP